jgi:hypothetical protein
VGDDVAVIVGFAVTMLGWILIIWLNLSSLKGKVHKWRSDLVPLFIFSIGSVRPGKASLWTQQGYSQTEAQIIVRQQLLYLLEFPIAFLVACVLSTLSVR